MGVVMIGSDCVRWCVMGRVVGRVYVENSVIRKDVFGDVCCGVVGNGVVLYDGVWRDVITIMMLWKIS